MELGMACPFHILNTRTGPDVDPKNYGYFMGILFKDLNRPGPEKNRPEPKLKISMYLLGLKCLEPKDADPKGTGPNPTRRSERPCLLHFTHFCSCEFEET